MRFILIRAAPPAAIDAAATLLAGKQAQILLPGHRLCWQGLAAHSCFVIPLA